MRPAHPALDRGPRRLQTDRAAGLRRPARALRGRGGGRGGGRGSLRGRGRGGGGAGGLRAPARRGHHGARARAGRAAGVRRLARQRGRPLHRPRGRSRRRLRGRPRRRGGAARHRPGARRPDRDARDRGHARGARRAPHPVDVEPEPLWAPRGHRGRLRTRRGAGARGGGGHRRRLRHQGPRLLRGPDRRRGGPAAGSAGEVGRVAARALPHRLARSRAAARGAPRAHPRGPDHRAGDPVHTGARRLRGERRGGDPEHHQPPARALSHSESRGGRVQRGHQRGVRRRVPGLGPARGQLRAGAAHRSRRPRARYGPRGAAAAQHDPRGGDAVPHRPGLPGRHADLLRPGGLRGKLRPAPRRLRLRGVAAPPDRDGREHAAGRRGARGLCAGHRGGPVRERGRPHRLGRDGARLHRRVLAGPVARNDDGPDRGGRARRGPRAGVRDRGRHDAPALRQRHRGQPRGRQRGPLGGAHRARGGGQGAGGGRGDARVRARRRGAGRGPGPRGRPARARGGPGRSLTCGGAEQDAPARVAAGAAGLRVLRAGDRHLRVRRAGLRGRGGRGDRAGADPPLPGGPRLRARH